MNGIFTTKTFWVGLATAVSGLATLFGGVDFNTVEFTLSGIIAFAQTMFGTAGWETFMVGLAMITGRHAIAKIGSS